MTKRSGLTKLQQAVLLTASSTPTARARVVMDAGYSHGQSTIEQVDDLVERGFLHQQRKRQGAHLVTLTDKGRALAAALRAAGVEVEP